MRRVAMVSMVLALTVFGLSAAANAARLGSSITSSDDSDSGGSSRGALYQLGDRPIGGTPSPAKPVPEPGAALLFAVGLAAVGMRSRRS